VYKRQVEYLEASKTVRFGTYGRGIFDFVFLDALSDSDNDGVADIDDICPGFDDNIDTDEDGIPDGCDLCDDTNPLMFDLVVNNPIICAKEGVIDLDISGGAPPYTFENNGSPITLPFESNIEGSYDFSIRDANNCKLDTSTSATLTWSTGETGAEINNLGPGVYSVTATDENGCMLIENFTIENESSTSVGASPILNFDMSPNPAKDFLLVSLSTAGALPYEFKIVDMLGREVWSTRDNKSTSSFTVDLNNIEAGTYFCIVKSGSSTKSEKLIVVK